jgi:MFS transporter, PPP family, 3-phenylpropionic acid transporter
MLTRRLRLSPLAPTPLWLGSLFYLFYWSFAAVYDPFLNVYLANEKGLTGLQIGILAVCMPLAALLLAPFISALADRRGWRLRTMQILLVGWIAALLLLRLPTTFVGFLPVMVLLAIFRSPTAPIGDSLIAQMASTHRLSYGHMRLWGSLGFALTSILAGMAWRQYGYSLMFVAAALTAVPCLLLITRLEEKPLHTRQPSGSAWALLRDSGLLTLFTVTFLVAVPLLSTFTFGGIYMGQLGGDGVMVGLMFGLSALAEVPIMRRSSAIMARLTAPGTLLLGVVVLAVSVYGHAFAPNPTILLLAATLKGVGYGLFFVTLIYLIDARTPDGWKSTSQAMMNASFLGLAPLLTSAISGYIFDVWGGDTLFLISASFAVAAVALLAVAISKRWL